MLEIAWGNLRRLANNFKIFSNCYISHHQASDLPNPHYIINFILYPGQS